MGDDDADYEDGGDDDVDDGDDGDDADNGDNYDDDDDDDDDADDADAADDDDWRAEEGRGRRRKEEERGALSLQNEDPTPQDGWEKMRCRSSCCAASFGCALGGLPRWPKGQNH